jgi:hypothetical protein
MSRIWWTEGAIDALKRTAKPSVQLIIRKNISSKKHKVKAGTDSNFPPSSFYSFFVFCFYGF